MVMPGPPACNTKAVWDVLWHNYNYIFLYMYIHTYPHTTDDYSYRSKKPSECEEFEEAAEPDRPPPVVIASEFDVYDELYDDGDEEALDSLDAHGSIIKHLLSQV